MRSQILAIFCLKISKISEISENFKIIEKVKKK